MFAGYAQAAEPWSGAYVGFHNGGAWGDSDWTLSNGSSAAPNLDAGALFGGHAGILGQRVSSSPALKSPIPGFPTSMAMPGARRGRPSAGLKSKTSCY